MDKETVSMGGFGFIALFLLILFALFSNGGFWGNRGNAFLAGEALGGLNYGYGWNTPGDIRAAVCSSEKQGIIDSARTLYAVEQQGAETRAAISTKIDFYAYQDVRDQLAEAKARNMQLENQIADERRYNALSAELADIRCNMLKAPKVYGVGQVCQGSLVPSNLCPTTPTTPAA